MTDHEVMRSHWAASEWAQLFPHVRAICRRQSFGRAAIGFDGDDLDDLVAVAMWRCVRHPVPDNPVAFVTTMARRILIDMRTKTPRHRFEHSRLHRMSEHDEALLSDAPDADEVMMADESRRKVRAAVWLALRDLPESQRTIVVARDFEEIPVAEIAASAGATVDQMKMRLHRARQTFFQHVRRWLSTPDLTY